MSKKWKVVIGVAVAAVIVSGIGLLHLGSVIYWSSGGERGWSLRAHVSELIWGSGASEYIPSFGRGLAIQKGEAGMVPQFEVRLLDDDGDGVPDRGVIEVPTGLPFGQDFGPGRGSRFGPGYSPHFGRGFSPHFGRGFGPFLIVGGLFRLAFLALLIGLGVVFFHRWSRTRGEKDPQHS